MAVALSFLFLLLITLYSSTQQQVSAQLILEQGYTVSTVLNANKLPHPINPSALLPTLNNAGGGGTHSVFVLDSPSSVFYTVPFPISQDGDVRRYAGNGSAGFVDGELSFAKFDRPRSFAVDFKGNVYVADKSNHAIRKISKSGVTTIAGGHSRKPGNVDGPAQNASFSEDFELVFVPGVCALLITDRGNRLVRQMNLKPNDCKSGSYWQLGSTGSIWLGVICFILGSIITSVVTFVAYPFIISCTGNHRLPLVQRDMEALPNQSGETSSDSLLRHQKRSC